MNKSYSVQLSVEELAIITESLHLMRSIQESQKLHGIGLVVNPMIETTRLKLSDKLNSIDLDQE